MEISNNMFGFVKTEEKQRLSDNNDLLEEKKREDKLFTIAFSIVSFKFYTLLYDKFLINHSL